MEAREAATAQEILREIEEAGLEASEDLVGEVVGMGDVGEEGAGGEDGEETDGIGEEGVEMEKVLNDLDMEEGDFQYTDEGLDDVRPENDGLN